MIASLTVDRVLPAPPPRVWAALTTADGLATWWWTHLAGTTYAVDLRVGGEYRIDSPTAGIGVHGRYLALDAPHAYTATWVWVDDGVDGPEERVELTFAPHADGTRLTVVHSGAWTDGQPAEAYRQGWSDTLDALAEALLRPTPPRVG